ncbi:radical SAM peptide maturase, CXXX-repeat target family [Clostridium sp. ATCC 25772]|uniref:radical SAM peptide maturase, CXXX-repeat target family n=1 Tax=Clostridium sp. ATCC 25772 TaxID=1676991 RepID=UPI000782F8AD|nr:radical SAM peptide maturase, CXXX-repeat target family [Clostridium sp. ATCC 25772]
MEKNEVKMGKIGEVWDGNERGKGVKNITFCLTEDCNLVCKYCYMVGKNNKKKMSFDVAKKCVDYILSNRDIFNEGAVVWDFIGGEPFLEIDLLDKICDYIKLQMYILNHPWFNAYRFSLSTNGILYNTEKVQKFIKKNRYHLSIGFSVDGNEIKHNLQRVYPNGKGSYKDVVKNVPLWLSQFENGETKATFSHDDLPYLKDSIISLWNIGIKTVSANVVFEDVWREGDDIVLEKQLNELGDYIIENELWDKYSVRFFDPAIGHPLDEHGEDKNYCGAGKMLAIDCEGNFYPCIRFLDFSLNNKTGRKIGDIVNGIDSDKLRPFLGLTLKSQSKTECVNCEVASGCSWCTGFNYDAAESNTIYSRATYNCNMYKATIRANKKFWEKYEIVTGKKSPRRNYKNKQQKYLQIVLDDSNVAYCNYNSNNENRKNIMQDEVIKKGIAYAKANEFNVIFIGSKNINKVERLESCGVIVNSTFKDIDNNDIVVYENNTENLINSENCILVIDTINIEKITDFIKDIYEFSGRVNLVLRNFEKWNQEHIDKYKIELNRLIDFVEGTYVNKKPIEINIITDRLYLNKQCNCDAGISTFTLMPNGKIYICPAFYFDNSDNCIGDIYNGILNKEECLMSLNKAPICMNCDSYQCKRCIYLNKKLTGEYNTPSKIQCLLSHYERDVSRKLQQRLINKGLISNKNIITKLDYNDPLEKIVRSQGGYINV